MFIVELCYQEHVFSKMLSSRHIESNEKRKTEAFSLKSFDSIYTNRKPNYSYQNSNSKLNSKSINANHDYGGLHAKLNNYHQNTHKCLPTHRLSVNLKQNHSKTCNMQANFIYSQTTHLLIDSKKKKIKFTIP